MNFVYADFFLNDSDSFLTPLNFVALVFDFPLVFDLLNFSSFFHNFNRINRSQNFLIIVVSFLLKVIFDKCLSLSCRFISNQSEISLLLW